MRELARLLGLPAPKAKCRLEAAKIHYRIVETSSPKKVRGEGLEATPRVFGAYWETDAEAVLLTAYPVVESDTVRAAKAAILRGDPDD